MKSVWSNWKNKGKRGFCVQQAPLFFWEDHILKTDRCSIYEIKESDLADVRILFTDDEVRTYLGGAYDKASAEEKLRNMMGLGLTKTNINEFGRLDELKKSVDKAKAKAYFEKKEGVKLIPPKVNQKTDSLLREFIVTGGFEV